MQSASLMWDDDNNATQVRIPMPAAVLIHVAPVTPTLAAGVRAVEVSPAQSAYVGNTAFNLLDAQSDANSEAMAILANGRVIGFYRLDFAPRAVVGRELGTPHVGVRAFCLDHRQQGRGHGSRAAAAMAEDARRRHPDRRLMVLAVHARNRIAIAAYQRAGFVHNGQYMPGGRAGPQLVMFRLLPPIR